MSTRKMVVVNVLCWAVAALLHPVASLLPSAAGGPPKIFSLLIPLTFIGLAYCSSLLVARSPTPR